MLTRLPPTVASVDRDMVLLVFIVIVLYALWTVERNLWKSYKVAVTSAGELRCQYIFHIAPENGIETGIKACLAEADKRRLLSITFPLLGTGVYCKLIS